MAVCTVFSPLLTWHLYFSFFAFSLLLVFKNTLFDGCIVFHRLAIASFLLSFMLPFLVCVQLCLQDLYKEIGRKRNVKAFLTEGTPREKAVWVWCGELSEILRVSGPCGQETLCPVACC